MAFITLRAIEVSPHHKKEDVCSSRAKYRDGRRDTSVKVYTINQESVYLLIQGVPPVGAQNELQVLCEQYGEVAIFQPLDEYPCEEFTEVYVVKYQWFPAARTAKKHLDDKSFFGGTLHVCYAPEFETVSDTRQKLQERRKYVAWKTKSDQKKEKKQHKFLAPEMNAVSTPQTSIDPASCSRNVTLCEPVTYIWAGKEYTVYPQSSESSSSAAIKQCDESEAGNLTDIQQKHSSQLFLPRQLGPATQKTTENSSYSRSDNLQNSSISSTSDNSVNLSTPETCYSSSVENIKQKLLHVAVPNVRVSFKRRKMM